MTGKSVQLWKEPLHQTILHFEGHPPEEGYQSPVKAVMAPPESWNEIFGAYTTLALCMQTSG